MHEKLLLVLKALTEEPLLSEYGELFKTSDDDIRLRIPIGSKTGTGDIYYDEESDNVMILTRYNQKDTISLEDPVYDIAYVAWRWYLDYVTRGYNISSYWSEIWERMGLITRETKTVTGYKIN